MAKLRARNHMPPIRWNQRHQNHTHTPRGPISPSIGGLVEVILRIEYYFQWGHCSRKWACQWALTCELRLAKSDVPLWKLHECRFCRSEFPFMNTVQYSCRQNIKHIFKDKTSFWDLSRKRFKHNLPAEPHNLACGSTHIVRIDGELGGMMHICSGGVWGMCRWMRAG